MTWHKAMPLRQCPCRDRSRTRVQRDIDNRRNGEKAALREKVHDRSESGPETEATAPIPVDPKPPVPLSVAPGSTSLHVKRATGARTICAIRVPRRIAKGSWPWLISRTCTSPR